MTRSRNVIKSVLVRIVDGKSNERSSRPRANRIEDLYLTGKGWRLVNGEYEEV